MYIVVEVYFLNIANVWLLIFSGFGRNASSDSMTPTTKRVCSELERENSSFCLEDMSTRLACSQPEAPTSTSINAVVSKSSL